MNFINYVWNIEESHSHLLKDTISQEQYNSEINSIIKRMIKSGLTEEDRIQAITEGKLNAINHFKMKATKE